MNFKGYHWRNGALSIVYLKIPPLMSIIFKSQVQYIELVHTHVIFKQ